jgi:hypothetical protein
MDNRAQEALDWLRFGDAARAASASRLQIDREIRLELGAPKFAELKRAVLAGLDKLNNEYGGQVAVWEVGPLLKISLRRRRDGERLTAEYKPGDIRITWSFKGCESYYQLAVNDDSALYLKNPEREAVTVEDAAWDILDTLIGRKHVTSNYQATPTSML